MELAPMFIEQRWNILKQLSKKRLSPLQLAASTNTTIANISQQLRLLEAANLVKKERVPNRDKGQPRLLFSLADDHAYIVSLMDNFAQKQLVKLSGSQKIFLKMLSIEDTELRGRLEELYVMLHPHLDKLEALGVDLAEQGILAVITDKALKRKCEQLPGVKTISLQRFQERMQKSPDHVVVLHAHFLLGKPSDTGSAGAVAG